MTRAISISFAVLALVGCTTTRPTSDAPPPAETALVVHTLDGADGLPELHPCHDGAPVTVTALSSDLSHTTSSTRSLDAVLRRAPGDRTAAVQRRVSGLHGHTDGGQWMVTVCEVDGASLWFEPDARPPWSLDETGEPNAVEIAAVAELHRSGDGEPWRVVHARQVASNDDEGNAPGYLARAGILSVTDRDGDGVVEVSSWTLVDCRTFSRDQCDGAVSGREPLWVAEHQVREGDEVSTARYLFELDAPGGRRLDTSAATASSTARLLDEGVDALEREVQLAIGQRRTALQP